MTTLEKLKHTALPPKEAFQAMQIIVSFVWNGEIIREVLKHVFQSPPGDADAVIKHF
jgi:hypothetical protein